MPPDSVDARIGQADLARLLARVRAGEEIVITQEGAPVARLVPEADSVPRSQVRFGLLTGQLRVPADFNDEDEELNALFYEGEIFPVKR